MKNSWILSEKEEAAVLLSQESVSDFLMYYYQQTKKHWPAFSYSFLAREMGVSKSLILGIFNGSKALSPKNLGPLLKTLKLPDQVKDYFEALASDLSPQKRNKILKNLRQAFLENLESGLNVNTSISDPDFAILYASLGEEETGVTVEEIMKKINWPEERIRFLLNELQLKKFVKLFNKTHWKGTKKFISAVANNQNDWLPKLFLSTLERHRKLAEKDFFSKQHLSLTYTFCINKEEQDALNTELKKSYEWTDEKVSRREWG